MTSAPKYGIGGKSAVAAAAPMATGSDATRRAIAYTTMQINDEHHGLRESDRELVDAEQSVQQRHEQRVQRACEALPERTSARRESA